MRRTKKKKKKEKGKRKKEKGKKEPFLSIPWPSQAQRCPRFPHFP